MTSQPACSTRRLDPRRRQAEITFAAGLTPRDKNGVPCVLWGFGPFFLKRTTEGSSRYNCRHNSDSAAGFCPFRRPRLALSEPRHTCIIQRCSATPACSPLSRFPSAAGSNPRKSIFFATSARFFPVGSWITSPLGSSEDFSSGGGRS